MLQNATVNLQQQRQRQKINCNQILKQQIDDKISKAILEIMETEHNTFGNLRTELSSHIFRLNNANN